MKAYTLKLDGEPVLAFRAKDDEKAAAFPISSTRPRRDSRGRKPRSPYDPPPYRSVPGGEALAATEKIGWNIDDGPAHAINEEFAAEGYTHIECFCPKCRVIRLQPMSWLPRISMGLTLAQLSTRLRCAECGGPLQSVKPWRQADMLGKPEGRSGYTEAV